MSALLSINYLAGNAPASFTGTILGFPEPRDDFTVTITGGFSPLTGSYSIQCQLEGTNDVTSYTGGFPNLLGWTQSGGVYTIQGGAQAWANWTPILYPVGNIMNQFGAWRTKELATVFNGFTGGQIFPNLHKRFAAVRLKLLSWNGGGSNLALGASVAASGTEAH